MGEGVRHPARLDRHRRDLAGGSDRPEQRQHRKDHGKHERDGPQPIEPGPHPQPEIEAEHRVPPGDDQHRQLQVPAFRGAHEQRPQDEAVIVGIEAEKAGADPVGDDMPGQQDRDREAEHQLQQFGGAQPQAPPLPQRPQRQPVMHQEAAVEQR